MNQVPDDMYHRCVHLLDPVDAVGRHDEAVIGYFRKAPAILARKSYCQHLFFSCCLQRVNQIWHKLPPFPMTKSRPPCRKRSAIVRDVASSDSAYFVKNFSFISTLSPHLRIILSRKLSVV